MRRERESELGIQKVLTKIEKIEKEKKRKKKKKKKNMKLIRMVHDPQKETHIIDLLDLILGVSAVPPQFFVCQALDQLKQHWIKRERKERKKMRKERFKKKRKENGIHVPSRS